VRRPPRPALRPFVETVWALDERDRGTFEAHREHVIPTGGMHVVFRLGDDPLRLFDHESDRTGRLIGTMLIGGARSRFYIREVAGPSISVGAVLKPGAAELLFGVPANELSDAHTALEDVWGQRARAMRDELAELPSPGQRLDAFEQILACRLPIVQGIHPAVASALQQLRAPAAIHEVVRASGYSHRRFIALFTRAVGLTPKTYCRVLRFQRVLRSAASAGSQSLADVAMAAGYSDQSHLNREFREFTGVTPGQYRWASPRAPHHVRVGPR
jgi:AraC-like DNA-binding protein